MTKQELWLQEEEEEKYDIYTSTIGYEGDDSNLDSETDTESEGQAYPFLDWRLFTTNNNEHIKFEHFS